MKDENKSKINEYIRGELFPLHFKDLGISIAIFVIVTVISFFFNRTASDPTLNIAMLYTIGVYLVSRYTDGYLCGILFSLSAVLSVNFFFTYPYGDFNFSIEGYQVTFVGMLVISIITSVTSTRMKIQQNMLTYQAKELMEADKEKMRANLLRAVSHDLRTPLTGIIGSSDSLIENSDDYDECEKIELIQNIRDDADWLLNMVENLLSVTRIDSDKRGAGVTKSVEAVDEVVEASVVKFKKRFPAQEVKVKLPDEVIMAEMDSMLIQQVIINILQNAAIHANSKKSLELFLELNGDWVDFHIKDYGVGIKPDKLATIFDVEDFNGGYQQSDAHKGIGIGLSICKTIINAHGGTISVHNHGEGAEFIFSLQAIKEDYKDVSENIDSDN